MIKFLLWNLENQDLSKLDHVRARRSLGVQSHPGVTIRRRASGSICSPRLGAQKYHRPSAENQAFSRNTVTAVLQFSKRSIKRRHPDSVVWSWSAPSGTTTTTELAAASRYRAVAP